MIEAKKATCEWCNELFIPLRKDSRYCPAQHFTNCKTCEIEISIKAMKRIPVYCSISCGGKDRTYKLICELCGDEFTAGKKDAKFCSKAHRKNCEVCNKTFEFDSYNRVIRTCSRVCASRLIDFAARNAKAAETLSRKHGKPVVNASQLEVVKEKKQATMIERYGVTNPSQVIEFKTKREATNLERYGVTNGGGAPEVLARIRETNLARYGVANVFQSEPVKKKIADACEKRYGAGIKNPFQDPATREAIKATLLERYGVESMLSLPEVQLASSATKKKRISNLNRKWAKTLETELLLPVQLEVPFGDNKYADLVVKEILVEINPVATHNSVISFVHLTQRCLEDPCEERRHRPIAADSHLERFLAAEAEGKTLLQYFDWYDETIFKSILRSKLHLDDHKVYAKKCQVKVITQRDANRFFRENHLLGPTKGQTFCVGLFYDEELVHCHSYGPARLTKKYEWEAIRSVSKMGWHVQGGFSRADKTFFRTMKPKSVVSYVDLAISTGATETANPGWRLMSTNPPAATWCYVGPDSSLGRKPHFVRDLSAQKLSADRLLGLEIGAKYPSHHADGSKFTNDDVLLSEGYLKVYDAGTRTFSWSAEETV